MIRSLSLLILLFFGTLEALTLKEKMKSAHEGDFVVTEQSGGITFLKVHAIDTESLILEEIACPPKFPLKKGSAWGTWILEGAPGHTSWTLLEIDLQREEVNECFSFTRNAWLLLTKEDSFLIKLLSLPLQPIPPSERKRIGPKPLEGVDTRKIWTPTLVTMGEKKSSPHFDAYRAIWPKDNTPLSSKQVELYFNRDDKEFPFPYWTQVTDASEAAYKIRVLDSGKGLPSSGKTLPRRPLTFLKTNEYTEKGLVLEISCPVYYKHLELRAIDHFENAITAISLPFRVERVAVERAGEKKQLIVDWDTLNALLSKNHSYSLLLSSDFETSVESKDLFVFKGIEE